MKEMRVPQGFLVRFVVRRCAIIFDSKSDALSSSSQAPILQIPTTFATPE
jgi:hypothetical protein